MAFSPKNLKIWVNSREIHAIIQTATKRPFTKGTLPQQAERPCTCAHLAKTHNLPLVDGHIVARKPKDLRSLFGAQAAIVLPDIRNSPTPSRYETKQTFVHSARHILKSLPVQTDTADAMYSNCVSHLKSAWHVERQVVPWNTRAEAITQFKTDWSEQFACTP